MGNCGVVIGLKKGVLIDSFYTEGQQTSITLP